MSSVAFLDALLINGVQEIFGNRGVLGVLGVFGVVLLIFGVLGIFAPRNDLRKIESVCSTSAFAVDVDSILSLLKNGGR